MTPIYQIHSYLRRLPHFALLGQRRNDARRELFTPIAALALAVAAIGCEDFDAPKEPSSPTRTDGGQTDVTSDVGFDGGGGTAGIGANAKPPTDAAAVAQKVTLKDDFIVARASEKFIFVPNPDKRVVTVLDPKGLTDKNRTKISLVRDCGSRPKYLGVDSDENVAIVIDSETGQGTIIRKAPSTQQIRHLKDASICRNGEDLCSIRGANAVAFSPYKGKYAVIYYSPEHVNDGEPAGGYQEIVVVGYESGTEWARRISVGLRPRKIFFAAGDPRLYLVTDDGISVINLTTADKESPSTANTYDFGGGVDVSKLQIEISEYGDYALGFKPNDSKVYLLEFPTTTKKVAVVKSLDMATILNWRPAVPDAGVRDGGARDAGEDDAGTLDAGLTDANANDTEPVDAAAKDAGSRYPTLMPGETASVTDIALGAPPGGTLSALVALPKQNAVLRVPVPDGFDPENLLSITTAYRNERNDQLAITSSSDVAPTALLLDQAGLAPRVTLMKVKNDSTELVKSVRLAGSVDSATFAADVPNVALFTHNLESSKPGAQVIGYTTLSVNPPFAKFQATTAPIGSFVFAAEAETLFIIVRDDANSVRQLHRVSFDGLFVNVTKLDEKPRTLGLLSDLQQIFVEQEHSDGLITIYDWNGQLTGSFTGYLMTDRVKE